jgi:hypothetical protein
VDYRAEARDTISRPTGLDSDRFDLGQHAIKVALVAAWPVRDRFASIEVG